MNVIDALIIHANVKQRAAITKALTRIPHFLLTEMHGMGVRYIAMRKGDRYADHSRILRQLRSGVDDWPIPPAGLTIVEERRVILRSCSLMTVIHESMHALDLTLGGGVYLSCMDPGIRTAFADARAFVTPYAASSLDEYFAESARAMLSANDSGSLWPPATPERLEAVDPRMYGIMQAIFQNTEMLKR